jgi:hypothetical protein
LFYQALVKQLNIGLSEQTRKGLLLKIYEIKLIILSEKTIAKSLLNHERIKSALP